MPAKIYITGPESTGKTTLAKALAKSLGSAWVPEYARTYLGRLTRPYRKSDLLEIAKAQANWEDGARSGSGQPIVCDTGMLVLKIWSEYKFGDANKWITKRLEQQRPHLHLLCAPDIPWSEDPLRENPVDREALFAEYKKQLDALNFRYKVISGDTREERLAHAQQLVQEFQS